MPPTKRLRHFPNRMAKIKNAINEGEGIEEGGNPPFMVMQIWLQNNNELKTTPPEKAEYQMHLHQGSTADGLGVE